MRNLTPWQFQWRLAGLCALALAAVAAVVMLVPRIPQDPAYHSFSDTRTIAGVPNFWNVVSNAPFLLVGAYGVWAWLRARWIDKRDRWPWAVLVGASFLIGIGSGYYHWTPDTRTLFWDRLPMTLGFMGVFSAVINERVHRPGGLFLLGPFLALGVLSVEVWRQGELTGVGDLRFYALVQFYPMLAIPLMLLLFPARYTESRGLWWMVGWYGVAKALELADEVIWGATGGWMGGHAVKHVAAAVAVWVVFRMLGQRERAE